ncbi:MAG: hypothetical protein JSV51_03965 [Candidatus Bathyarchaeota archaeon]|nr:MAG: hypothetical protein JSV51_03965 [Candidatus Bathyarchaeota archaeon]
MRKIFLLLTCMGLLKIDKPVSIRNKDYYLKCKEYFSTEDYEKIFGKIQKRQEIGSLINKTIQVFYNEVKNREPWTELKDAENHFLNKEDFLATISLQNGAYYLGYVGLSNRGCKAKNRGFLYPESEIGLIRKTNECWKEYHDLYSKIHNVEAWDDREINSAFNYLLNLSREKDIGAPPFLDL